MSAVVNKAAAVLPPIAGSVVSRAHSTTAARYEIPTDWRDNYVTVYSETDTLYIAFGDGGVMVSAQAVSQVSGETIAPNAGTGIPVKGDTFQPFYVPPEATHFAVDSGSATGSATWIAYRSSGAPHMFGEPMPVEIGGQIMWMDALSYNSVSQSSGVVSWRSKEKVTGGHAFVETTNKPEWTNAVSTAALCRPTIKFTGASSHKLVSTSEELCAALSDSGAFTLALAFSRAALGTLETLFSCGGSASSGRMAISINASNQLVIQRHDLTETATTSTGSTVVTAAKHLLVVTFDGTTPLAWLDRVSESLTGTATDSIETITKCAFGCRAYASNDQFFTGEIAEAFLWPKAFSSAEVGFLHAWLKRRYAI